MKHFLFTFLRYTGLPYLMREVFQRNKVTILLFHDLQKNEADLIFRTIKQKYNIIPLSLLMETLETENWNALPKKSVVITFDDGVKSNYNILPEIKKNGVPVTIFLCAGIINTNRHFWFHKDHPYVTKKQLKKKPNWERLKLLSEIGFHHEKEYETPQALNTDQIKEMQSFVDFQAHTFFHPVLTKCSDIEAREEIAGSKDYLEDNYGLKVKVFSYPNGDYSDREINICKESGYVGAITVDYGFNGKNTNPFALKRLPLDGTTSIDELLVKASGLSEILSVITFQKPGTKYKHS